MSKKIPVSKHKWQPVMGTDVIRGGSRKKRDVKPKVSLTVCKGQSVLHFNRPAAELLLDGCVGVSQVHHAGQNAFALKVWKKAPDDGQTMQKVTPHCKEIKGERVDLGDRYVSATKLINIAAQQGMDICSRSNLNVSEIQKRHYNYLLLELESGEKTKRAVEKEGAKKAS